MQTVKSVLRAGVWHVVALSDMRPTLSAWHRGQALAAPAIAAAPHEGAWEVSVTLPADMLSDGAHSVLLRDDETGAQIAHLSILAGEAVGEDLRAEIDLLRAELDMLKRAFRRQCREGA